MGIGPGQIVEMIEERGRILLTKAATTDPVDEVYGILGGLSRGIHLVGRTLQFPHPVPGEPR